ncbi:MAG: hypothetical protein HC780_09830 [Leptolyngbyaceae cyanobacterium CSU_1_3]|nr:hypothetical protein [Leptolyngbyaceae cyanobacterium CSU_1_3]
MLYAIPKTLTTNGYEVGWNYQLSATDKPLLQKRIQDSCSINQRLQPPGFLILIDRLKHQPYIAWSIE